MESSARTCRQTKDMEYVRSFIAHPKVYPEVTDDFAPPIEEFMPSEAGIYLILRERSETAREDLGIVALAPWSQVCWELHSALKPSTWWKGKARKATLAAIEWVWKNSECQRIVACVPVLNHRTRLKFPLRLGMVEFGRNKNSFMKGGKLRDQVLFGISRPKVGKP